MAATALVTGGSGGIGRAICELLAGDWDVAVHYHDDEAATVDVANATVPDIYLLFIFLYIAAVFRGRCKNNNIHSYVDVGGKDRWKAP